MKISHVATLSTLGCLAVVGMTGCISGGETSTAAQEAAVPAPPITNLYAGSPYLGELRNSVVYGEIWERPILSKRDRSLITVAVTQALYATDQVRTHIGRALDENGVTPQELSEANLHVTFYAGWPAAVNAGRLAAEAFEARGVSLDELQ